MPSAGLSVLVIAPPVWPAAWAWSVPLIVLTVIIHVLGLGFVNGKIMRVSDGIMQRHHPTISFVVIVGIATWSATSLHAVEVVIWAAAYRLIDALPENGSAILYSLNAMTSYGHTNLFLDGHWELMGAMEALNGWLLFGLTTAFLFGILAKVWSLAEKRG